MTQKPKIDPSRIEVDMEWFGLASATQFPLDRIDAFQKFMTSSVEVFLKENSERLIREFQAGLARGVHYRLDPKTFTPPKHITYGDYDEYLTPQGDKAPVPPTNPTYATGDIVVVETPEEKSLAIVLGCICEESGDLRTDLCGMTPIKHIRFATKEDIQNDTSPHGKRICTYLQLNQ